PTNEKAKAETRKSRAEAATSEHAALVEIVSTAAKFDDDAVAREFIVSFDLTHALSDTAIDRLVEARFAFMEGGKQARDLRQMAEENPTFAALFGPIGLKKNFRDGVSFATEPDPVEEVTDRVEELAAGHFTRRLDAIKTALDDAPDLPAFARALLQLGAKWSPAALGNLLGDALELAALRGWDAVFQDEEAATEAGFADPDVFDQPFREQRDFIKQKRGKPTKTWTDAMRGVHDRAFVVAGVSDMALLSDFQTAVGNARTLEEFRRDFDILVAKYGWAYKGERGWRTRVIFETNIRTSFMAGRLKQMRDPGLLKRRPYWQYRHGDLRKPQNPRPRHLSWHGLVLRHDDPFWQTHYPPNGWFCSCGVRNLSDRDLARLGKKGPDPSPEPLFEPVIDPISGHLIEQPQGIDYGWDYQPGDLWERDLTPTTAMEEGRELLDNPRMAVEVDKPEPLADLMARAKPLKALEMKEGLPAEDYIRGFLSPFGADIDQGVLFEDKAGTKIPISDQLFRDRKGVLKVMKSDRARITPLLAEALMDPDEIWLGVARKKDPVDKDQEELIVDRRYVRLDQKSGLIIVFEIGERLWEAVTAYNGTTKTGKPDHKAIDRRRGGKLLYKRPKK
ncbi:PBECR2 nuclease fold domain-containing protein, partial [Shinella sp.]|uniref:PBECR2 nuclease fold domain-containing protein n=1 Tax=Shinella sp. TaxID=1870904 RepID=UPI003F70FC31